MSDASVCEIQIDASAPGAQIQKTVYGQFAEHLGACIYGGLWVGPDSPIPNTRGWRNDSVEALKELQVPVLRWPGGCFADMYHWRDGIGPREERPVQSNLLWGDVEEDNAVGTHEFFDLVEQLGAQAYINGNLGTGTPQEMSGWLEYMTSNSRSELAELRSKNGRDAPSSVDYFGVGNEAWGCGGHMEPEYYTHLYKHFGSFLRTPWDVQPKFVASGGHGEGTRDLTRWSDYLTANIEPDILLGFDAVSFHYYTHPKGDVMTPKGAATGFPEDEWMSTLVNTLKMDAHLQANVDVMDKNDPEKKIGLYVDEWGTWYDPEEGTNPGFLVQQNTLRDAIVAALNFNIFHKHAERVHMTNIAQMTNVLQAMLITNDDGVLRTPTFYVFKMFLPFHDASALAVDVGGAARYEHGGESIPAVSASAARGSDGKLYLSLVNVDPHAEQRVSLSVAGQGLSGLSGQILTAPEMDAHNSFENPGALQPAPYSAAVDGEGLQLAIPAKSVIVAELETR